MILRATIIAIELNTAEMYDVTAFNGFFVMIYAGIGTQIHAGKVFSDRLEIWRRLSDRRNLDLWHSGRTGSRGSNGYQYSNRPHRVCCRRGFSTRSVQKAECDSVAYEPNRFSARLTG